MQTKKYNIKSIQHKFNTQKTFFRYLNELYGIPNLLYKDKWLSKSTVNKILLLSGKTSLPLVLETKDVNTLLNSIHSSIDKLKYRDFAIFTILYCTGARHSDVLSLKRSDIYFHRDEIRLVHVKNGNEGICQLLPLLKIALSNLLSVSNLLHDYVFISVESNPLSKSAFSDLFHKRIDKCNVQSHYIRPIIPHTFRHTLVTNCIPEDVGIARIIEYTEHPYINSLSTYISLTPKDHESIANLHNDLINLLNLE